jgi:inorganic pyrophosphatase
VYFERTKDKVPVSPFHDIPLYHDKKKEILNMVVEIPRWSNAKFEVRSQQDRPGNDKSFKSGHSLTRRKISRTESLNPIRQDTLDRHPRFVKSCFPYKGYIWNYGALPQTWEDPHHTNPDTHARGDNDPLDAIEVGRRIAATGDVKPVKVLGVLALLDGGETDWKVLVIDVRDPLAEKLEDVADVEKHLPGLLDATRDWFRIYKVPDGKPGNKFAFGGRWKGKRYAMRVLEECRGAWERLVKGEAERGDICL